MTSTTLESTSGQQAPQNIMTTVTQEPTTERQYILPPFIDIYHPKTQYRHSAVQHHTYGNIPNVNLNHSSSVPTVSMYPTHSGFRNPLDGMALSQQPLSTGKSIGFSMQTTSRNQSDSMGHDLFTQMPTTEFNPRIISYQQQSQATQYNQQSQAAHADWTSTIQPIDQLHCKGNQYNQYKTSNTACTDWISTSQSSSDNNNNSSQNTAFTQLHGQLMAECKNQQTNWYPNLQTSSNQQKLYHKALPVTFNTVEAKHQYRAEKPQNVYPEHGQCIEGESATQCQLFSDKQRLMGQENWYYGYKQHQPFNSRMGTGLNPLMEHNGQLVEAKHWPDQHTTDCNNFKCNQHHNLSPGTKSTARDTQQHGSEHSFKGNQHKVPPDATPTTRGSQQDIVQAPDTSTSIDGKVNKLVDQSLHFTASNQAMANQQQTDKKVKPLIPRDRRNRFVSTFNDVVLHAMSTWYDRNRDHHPYPNKQVCEEFANTGGISVNQVKRWFSNRRQRDGNTKSLTQIAEERRIQRMLTSQKKKIRKM